MAIAMVARQHEGEAARAQAAREERRLEEAQRELEAATDRLRAADPEDDAALAALVQRRDALRGKVAALEGQVERALAATAEMKERQAALAAISEVAAEVAEKGKELDAELDAARRRVAARFSEIRGIAAKALATWDKLSPGARRIDPLFPLVFDPLMNAAACLGDADPLAVALRVRRLP